MYAPAPQTTGWFPVTSLDALARVPALETTWRGHRVAVMRDQSTGAFRVLQAHCPHLGAAFAAGGTVRDGVAKCPFHGWKFDAERGDLVQIGYSPRKPPKICVKSWRTRVEGDTLLAFDDAAANEHPASRSGRYDNRDGLDPFPAGWFAICFSHDLPRSGGQSNGWPDRQSSGGPNTYQGRWLGQRIEVHRNALGWIYARTESGQIITCDEQRGAIFGWHDPEGGPPAWRIPTKDPAGFTDYATHMFAGLDSHPQEVSENSVDIAHFTEIHGYAGVETLEPATPDGHVLRAKYRFLRPPFPGAPKALAGEFRIAVEVHGMGFSAVDVHVARAGIRTRQLVMPTPIGDGKIDLRIAAAVSNSKYGRLVDGVVRRLAMDGYIRDIRDDFEVWKHKRYVRRPVVVAGDGPIHVYRRWAKQFYARPCSKRAAA